MKRLIIVLLLVGLLLSAGSFRSATSPEPVEKAAFKYRLVIDDVEYICMRFEVTGDIFGKTVVIMTDVLGYPDVDQVFVYEHRRLIQEALVEE